MIKGLIFDLDGTLINSLKDIHYSVNLAIKEFGFEEVEYDFVRLNTGRGFRKLIEDSLPKGTSDKTIDEVNKVYTKYYGMHYNDQTVPYDGIVETLKCLQDMGIKLAVNSNKKDEYTKNLMSSLFPNINFFAVYGERAGINNKPDPTTALEIVKDMGLSKGEVLYVGDSEVDIRTAKNAGLKSIGCKWGFRKEDILYKEGCTYLIDSPNDIVKIVKGEI